MLVSLKHLGVSCALLHWHVEYGVKVSGVCLVVSLSSDFVVVDPVCILLEVDLKLLLLATWLVN